MVGLKDDGSNDYTISNVGLGSNGTTYVNKDKISSGAAEASLLSEPTVNSFNITSVKLGVVHLFMVEIPGRTA